MKEGKSEGVVILVGDSDFAYDAIAGRAQQVLNQTVFVPSNGNLNFIQSSVEQLAGDSDLIGIRSRSSGNRPFVVVNKMEAAAQQKYQSKIDDLEDNLNQTRQKLAALQTSKQSDQKTLLSPEQQAEIKKFQENEATVNKELKAGPQESSSGDRLAADHREMGRYCRDGLDRHHCRFGAGPR